MQTIDEYIAKMKRADKMDEFDYLKKSENMSAVINYVMAYFNDYLTLDTCDAENIKMKHKRDKLEIEIENRYPKSKEFILNYYLQNGIGIHKEVKKWLEQLPYFAFYQSEEDFFSAAQEFCAGYRLKTENMEEYLGGIQALMAEIKQCDTEEPKSSDMIHLDSQLVTWVRNTYKQYGVNLFSFAYDLASSYEQRYVKFERGEWGQSSYYVNNYNHRYNSNPFNIDEIFEENKHRPFLQDKRGELEMLVMHEWLFNMVYDDDYWPEYVNLCVDRGRVKVVQNINALLPVANAGLKYPDDIICETEYIIIANGKLKDTPNGSYILRVEETLNNQSVWQDTETMLVLSKSLDEIFKLYGTPHVLELLAPIKTGEFDEEKFLACCGVIEKKMKKHSGMKVAIVNGPSNQRSKPNSYIATIEDFIKLKVQLREMKIRLKFSIDFPALLSGKRNSYNQGEILGALTNMKNSIVVLHITNVQNQLSFQSRNKKIDEDLTVEFLDKFKYPTYDDFYSVLSIIINDNQQRYMVPKNITNDAQLETLVDNLLRAGFSL